MAHAELDPHPAIVAPGRSLRARLGLAGVPLGLLVLTLVACIVRAGGLPAVQGTMGRDEARLALAGRGILEHGLPILSDGFLYTRGLLPAYLNAATFLLFGGSDQVARLSDVIFASLLVPAVYRLGLLAGGARPAMAAAIIVAFSPPLVLQAREAWLYSTFLFWLTLALGWLVRDGPGDRLRAGLAALAALFSHELAVLFVPVALLLDLGRAWQARRKRRQEEAPTPGRCAARLSAATNDGPCWARTSASTNDGAPPLRGLPVSPTSSPLPRTTEPLGCAASPCPRTTEPLGCAASPCRGLSVSPTSSPVRGGGEQADPVSPPPAHGAVGTSAQVLSELASRRMFAPRSGKGPHGGMDGGRGIGASPRSVALFWTMLLAGVAAVVALSLTLRSQTLGGATVEFREYLRPTLDLRGLDLSLDILSGWHPWLLPAAILGIPLSRGGWRKLLSGRGLAACLLMLGAVLAFNSFGLVRRGESRYMLAAIPFVAIAAAVAVDRVGPSLVAVLTGRQRLGRTRHFVRFILLTLLVAASFDPLRLVADARSRAVSSTWVQALAGRAPDDLVVSFAPTLTSYYLGRTDFWLRSDGYSKYVWAGRTPLRDVHTGALVIRNPTELDQLLLAPNRGRTVWVVLAGEPAAESSRAMRELAQQLAGLAAETHRAGDGRVVLRIQL